MKLQTTKFGEVEVSEDYVFTFVEPIIGYDEYKEFALIDYNEKSPFKWLQAVDNPELALPVTIPAYFGIPYQFTIPDEKENILEAKDANSILALNIANIPNGEPQNATVNLLAPIVVNTDNKKAIQLILTNSDFSVRYKIFNYKDK